MVAWGLAGLLRAGGVRLPALARGPWRRSPLAPALRALAAQPPGRRALAVGLLTTLLPCGFLYAFVAIAAGTASPAWGAAVLATFWIGTLPVMGALGFGVPRLLEPLRARLPLVTAAVLVTLGLLTVAGRLGPHATHAHGAPAVTTGAPHGHH
jgi:sulfite exporter TauE/SafE